jgi:dihydrolipoamide dehydrogenase
MNVAVVEADKVGGVCLNIGCIPSKSLIHQAAIYDHLGDLEGMGLAIDRGGFDYGRIHRKSRKAAETLSKGVRYLLKKNKIALIEDYARIAGAGRVKLGSGDTLEGKNIIVATGSRPSEIPGFSIDEKKVLSSTGALMLQSLPASLLILGAGAIGVEFAYIMSAFGVEVRLVEMLDRVLPLEDSDSADVLRKAYKKRGVQIHTGTKAVSFDAKGKILKVGLEAEKGERQEVEAEMVLLAVGRRPNTEDIGLDSVGIETEKGYVPVGDYYQTAIPGLYAIGDVVASPLLAHVASREGEIAVEYIAGLSPEPRIDPLSIPSAVYSEPQVASFGVTEEDAKQRGLEYNISRFPYRGAGKSVAVEQPEGQVKIVTDKRTGEIIGAHVAGAEATELIHEILLARSGELLAEDVVGMIHAHPTLSEGVGEAMRAVLGRAIHI